MAKATTSIGVSPPWRGRRELHEISWFIGTAGFAHHRWHIAGRSPTGRSLPVTPRRTHSPSVRSVALNTSGSSLQVDAHDD